MIKISSTSMNRLRQYVVQRQIEVVSQRLVEKYRSSIRREMEEVVFRKFVEKGVEGARALEIYEDDNVFLLLALHFELTESQRRNSLVQEILVGILGRLEWGEGDRLEFIYENLSIMRGEAE